MDLFPGATTHSSSEPAMELRLPVRPVVTHAHAAADHRSVVLRLFDQLQPRLAGYVLGFGLPRCDAEDIVQETFLSLFRHLELGRPSTNLSGWLFRVAHNLALKKRSANQTTSVTLDHDVLEKHADPAGNAEEQLAFSQTQQCLRSVFDALPERDRRCLQLRAEGLKYRDIAAVLGISLGAVSLSLSRSLARMDRATSVERTTERPAERGSRLY